MLLKAKEMAKSDNMEGSQSNIQEWLTAKEIDINRLLSHSDLRFSQISTKVNSVPSLVESILHLANFFGKS